MHAATLQPPQTRVGTARCTSPAPCPFFPQRGGSRRSQGRDSVAPNTRIRIAPNKTSIAPAPRSTAYHRGLVLAAAQCADAFVAGERAKREPALDAPHVFGEVLGCPDVRAI